VAAPSAIPPGENSVVCLFRTAFPRGGGRSCESSEFPPREGVRSGKLHRLQDETSGRARYNDTCSTNFCDTSVQVKALRCCLQGSTVFPSS
jgi:hypothetical protein